MAMAGRMRMTETADLLTLTQWLSPAYPVGAFAWSHGLEAAIAGGDVSDAPGLDTWLRAVLAHGAGWTDAVLLAQAHAGQTPLADLAALAAALAPSRERRAETMEQGAAFARTTGALTGDALAPMAYPVAVGAAGASVLAVASGLGASRRALRARPVDTLRRE